MSSCLTPALAGELATTSAALELEQRSAAALRLKRDRRPDPSDSESAPMMRKRTQAPPHKKTRAAGRPRLAVNPAHYARCRWGVSRARFAAPAMSSSGAAAAAASGAWLSARAPRSPAPAGACMRPRNLSAGCGVSSPHADAGALHSDSQLPPLSPPLQSPRGRAALGRSQTTPIRAATTRAVQTASLARRGRRWSRGGARTIMTKSPRRTASSCGTRRWPVRCLRHARCVPGDSRAGAQPDAARARACGATCSCGRRMLGRRPSMWRA